MSDVVVLIDLENLRYGMLNNYGLEPNFLTLVEKARKHGRPSVMKAYADFSEHPDDVQRALDVAGIEATNISVKRIKKVIGGESIERVTNAADMVLALDAVAQAVEADRSKQPKTFLLVTGDRDYIKLVTLLRNWFGQRVIIVGVPGSVSGDLVTAAGETDHIEVTRSAPVDKTALKTQIVVMVTKRPPTMSFWTLKIIDQWTQDSRQSMPGTAIERRQALSDLVTEGVLKQRERQYKGKPVREAFLDEDTARKLGYLT
ncbi:MAG TPA: NYN domain-containing protein [Nitrospira sp.]|nr:NYN domain-containing protein [Nitrospira sp.]